MSASGLQIWRQHQQAVPRTVSLVAGVDEAGRGAWAGPVVVSAVLWPMGTTLPGLNDSKKLTPSRRQALVASIEQHALAYIVVAADNHLVDRINVLQATLSAMAHALDHLAMPSSTPVLIDGNAVPPSWTARATALVKGDSLEASIMAASVLAKTARDAWMSQDAHQQYPFMGFAAHKGYGVPVHQAALAQHGPTPLHRITFAPVAAAAKQQMANGTPRRRHGC